MQVPSAALEESWNDPVTSWTLTLTHPPQGPGRSHSLWGFWWSSDRWQWVGRSAEPTGSDPAPSGSTTWRQRSKSSQKNPELREFHKYNCPLVLHVPWFVHHNILFPQEALLDHPLVIQELRPDISKQINMKFQQASNVSTSHLTDVNNTSSFDIKNFDTNLAHISWYTRFEFLHVVADGVWEDDHTALALL